MSMLSRTLALLAFVFAAQAPAPASLTPEQRAKLAERFKQRGEKMKHRHAASAPK